MSEQYFSHVSINDHTHMTTRITIKKNGSISIEGADFEIIDEEGTLFDIGGRQRVSLCRCGQSATLPFCDSRHKEIGFEAGHHTRSLPPLGA
jgi:CDGSH-type Zn-finger protein